jgi:hypothetical protein
VSAQNAEPGARYDGCWLTIRQFADGKQVTVQRCLDCGALVLDVETHNRFHSILSSHAWALAVLKTAHIAAHVHDRFEVPDRINSRRFDNWSADALAEVITQIDGPGVPG